MKKIITTVSLAAFGATGLQAAYAPDLSPTSANRMWSVSAALRGFYDDNYLTAPSHGGGIAPAKRHSFGLEASPSFNLNIPLEQTFIGLGYTYRFIWYEDRDREFTDPATGKKFSEHAYDQAHQATLKLDHAFSEASKLEINDTFNLS